MSRLTSPIAASRVRGTPSTVNGSPPVTKRTLVVGVFWLKSRPSEDAVQGGLPLVDGQVDRRLDAQGGEHLAGGVAFSGEGRLAAGLDEVVGVDGDVGHAQERLQGDRSGAGAPVDLGEALQGLAAVVGAEAVEEVGQDDDALRADLFVGIGAAELEAPGAETATAIEAEVVAVDVG